MSLSKYWTGFMTYSLVLEATPTPPGDSGSEVEDWLKAERQLTGEGAEQLEELPEIEASPAPRPPVRRRAVAS